MLVKRKSLNLVIDMKMLMLRKILIWI